MEPEGFTRLTEETVRDFTAALDRLIQGSGGKARVRDGADDLGLCTLTWSHQDYRGVWVVECVSAGGAEMPFPVRTPDFEPGIDNNGVASFKVCDAEVVVCIDYGFQIPKHYRHFRQP